MAYVGYARKGTFLAFAKAKPSSEIRLTFIINPAETGAQNTCQLYSHCFV